MRFYRISFIACALLVAAQSAVAQGGLAARTPKDPGVATLISVLITGGGQMYAGETGRGAAMLGIGLGSLVLGASLSSPSCSTAEFGTDCSINTTPLTIGILAYVGTWIYGIADASQSVHRQNRKMLSASARIRPSLVTSPQGLTHLGLSIDF